VFELDGRIVAHRANLYSSLTTNNNFIKNNNNGGYMKVKKYLLVLTILVLSTALILSGCTPEATPDPDEGEGTNGETSTASGMFTYGFNGEPATLNPILSSDSISSGITNFVNDSLLKEDENLEIVGELAENWEVSDDGKTITFFLQDDVYWHDGEQLTADDVVFTMNMILDPKYTGVRASDLKYVEEIVALSDFEVQFKLSQVDVPMMEALAGAAMGIIPEHVFKDVPAEELREHQGSWNPIGTGPYKFVEYVSGQYTVLEANEDYWGEGPFIKTIMIKHFQDNQSVLSAFENGDIDYIAKIPVEDIDRLKENLSEEVTFVETPNNGYYYIGLKQNHKYLEDKSVRQALMYSLDRQTIIDTVFQGYGTVINSHSVPISWAHTDDVNEYPQDLEKAEQLFTEAGWTKGNDGFLYNEDGEKLEFTIVSMAGEEEKANVIAMVIEQWKNVGVDVDVEYYERSVLFNQYLDVGEFESYMWGWNLSNDPDSFNMFHSSQAKLNEAGEPDPNGTLKGFNDCEYINPEVDQLLEAGRKTYDTEERKVIYAQIQQILNEELPYIFLYTTNDVKAIYNNFENVIWSPLEPIDHHLWKIVE
jgi:peptide/nickel transport system substrate-binding protein